MLRDHSIAIKKKKLERFLRDMSAANCMLLASEKNKFPLKPLSHKQKLRNLNQVLMIQIIFFLK